jgi:septum formation protein
VKYVLASASERRKELLQRIVEDFDVVVSDFDEEKVEFHNDIESYVTELAYGKANDVLSKVAEDSVIIAADTIVVHNGEVLGKPKDSEHAYKMLKLLNGNVHRVYSAVVVINKLNKREEKECLFTEVTFSELTEEEINMYIKTGEPFDKAGAYGIQGLGGLFVEEINGCYYNVVGLPLNLLNKMLKKVL